MKSLLSNSLEIKMPISQAGRFDVQNANVLSTLHSIGGTPAVDASSRIRGWSLMVQHQCTQPRLTHGLFVPKLDPPQPIKAKRSIKTTRCGNAAT